VWSGSASFFVLEPETDPLGSSLANASGIRCGEVLVFGGFEHCVPFPFLLYGAVRTVIIGVLSP
jgi:hypothetical protein